MKYRSVHTKQAERIMTAFRKHSMYINDKYWKYSGDQSKENWSDRDRFVSWLAPKLSNRYIAYIDMMLIGATYRPSMDSKDMCYYIFDPRSLYGVKYAEEVMGLYGCDSKPIIIPKKKYMHVTGFRSVNEMSGSGYIAMSGTDVFGESVKMRIDYDNLRHFQYKEIQKDEFDTICNLFVDDRDDLTFVCKRQMWMDELREKKLVRKNCSYDKMPTVFAEEKIVAKDMDSAIDKFNETFGKISVLKDIEVLDEEDNSVSDA